MMDGDKLSRERNRWTKEEEKYLWKLSNSPGNVALPPVVALGSRVTPTLDGT